jgi:hypothetical protein
MVAIWYSTIALARSGGYSLWLVELPVLMGVALVGYRIKHGFWPWDRKRRKIERWRWLVETPADKFDQ